MENLSDDELIFNIKHELNIDNSLKELISRHSGIYLRIVNSYMKYCPSQSLREDIINDKDITIYDSALKYKKDKGAKFSTFLGNEAKWKCLNTANKSKKDNIFFQTEDFNFLKPSCKYIAYSDSESFKEEILSNFHAELKSYPDSRVFKIFKMRYSGDSKLKPWREISEKMNLSIQGCINIHNSALKKISKNIKSKYEINS